MRVDAVERDERNQYSPAGEVDRWGHLAAGAASDHPGRRRALRMLLALLVVVVAGTVLVFLLAAVGVLPG
ncbi:hypothetical protein GB931_04190 [Modestobacter sp. I12A-02628]|uniref:Uncharacterized protein n=1 Tax=Goekera deserti TaxID=2497753 RepID=A0A7K3WDF4_9ACTN|nr:hypothetical protein [Goekera deserti]MPQ97137.1 hypothetical protein [Goekera deserti]NDI46545.1 hypothetical protein [Goekera deserti]NEL54521.1 hypothetical protein [Goekera deserti]